MEYIAHRGLVDKDIKENTLEAFIGAINNSNYSGFELDVRVSKDGEFVIFHDSLIDGKLVKRMNYSELKEYGIITLSQVLKLETDKKVIIEIKDFEIDKYKLCKMLNKSKLNIYVMSFSNKFINDLSKSKRNFKVGTLNYLFNSENDYSYNDFICLLYLSVTDNILRYFKNDGIEVILYGIPHYLKAKDYKVPMIVDHEYIKKHNLYY
ncbi:MAG: glycerophosphodiester phosphodiesterase [Bacilli bacterium]